MLLALWIPHKMADSSWHTQGEKTRKHAQLCQIWAKNWKNPVNVQKKSAQLPGIGPIKTWKPGEDTNENTGPAMMYPQCMASPTKFATKGKYNYRDILTWPILICGQCSRCSWGSVQPWRFPTMVPWQEPQVPNISKKSTLALLCAKSQRNIDEPTTERLI